MVGSSEAPTSEVATLFLRFLDKYVSCVPGQRDISKFYKENPRMTLLDKLTPSDIAYTVLVYENTFEVWDETREWKKMNVVEQRNTPKVAVQKYFKKSGSKNKKYRDGWTSEGEKYYATLVKEFTDLMKNKVVWDCLRGHWKTYSRENSRYYYEEDEMEMYDQLDEESDQEDADGYVMDLPGLPAIEEEGEGSGSTSEQDVAGALNLVAMGI